MKKLYSSKIEGAFAVGSLLLSLSVFLTLWKTALPAIVMGHLLLYRWRNDNDKDRMQMPRFLTRFGLFLVYGAIAVTLILGGMWYWGESKH